MLAFTGIAVIYIFGTLLTANRNLRELNLLALSAVLLNLVLNLVLIPRHLAYGAAVSCLVTQWYVATGQVYIAFRLLKLRLSPAYLVRISLSVPLIFIGGYLVKNLLENWYLGLALLAAWTSIVAFSLKLVRFRDLLRLLPQTDE
jgi:O-antigen/teichoic acid export membrane protein